ncbi:cysteinyl leukotriene receptor 1 [Polypterus senegalus]
MILTTDLNCTQNKNNSQVGPAVFRNCSNTDGYKYTVYSAMYCVIFPLALTSNCLALYVFCRLTRKRTPSTVFMINLSFSDLLFSLTLPFRITYFFRKGEWDFPDWLCRFCTFAFYTNLYASILFLTCLSVVRYVAVLHPINARNIFTIKKAICTSVAMWIFVILSSCPFFLSGTFERGGKLRCFEPKDQKSWGRILIMNYFALVLGFLFPFFTILCCYCRIIRRLTSSQRDLRKSKQSRRRSIYLIVLVFISFIFCFLPYHIQRTVHLHFKMSRADCSKLVLMEKAVVITICLAATNSCLNPLIYYFVGQTFRGNISNAFMETMNSKKFHRQSNSSFNLSTRRESGCSLKVKS